MAGVAVRLKLTGTSSAGKTNADGRITAVDVPQRGGTHYISCWLEDDRYEDGTVSPFNQTGIMILPGAAKLSASGPSAVTSGQPFTVSATLKTSDGRPLSGKTVEVGGSSGKTDSRGEVTIQAKAEASFGIGQVKVPVRYLGDADWGESTTSIAVTIAPADN